MYCNPIWKPPKKKQKKAKNNKRATDQDCCIICSKPFAELHEIFYGPYRQKSIRYKLQVRLCIEHHREGPEAVHNNKTFDLQLKKEYQHKFEQQYSHEKFMQEFDKNYLDCEVA